MFKKYTDIIYNGSFETPIKITFKESGYSMMLAGEGGNRRLLLANATGSVDLWVDTHCFNDRFAFIHSVVQIQNPGTKFVQYIKSQMDAYGLAGNDCWHFSETGLNRFFAQMYKDMFRNKIPKD